MSRIPVAVLGATGTVGQKFARLLENHPWFEVVAVAASSQSAGKTYAEATRWRETTAIPGGVAGLTVQPCEPTLSARVVFSALDADVAGPIERAFAKAGAYVVTNTKTHRLDPDVPLLIPEVNAAHLCLLLRQQAGRGWTGGIVANPNCSTAALALAMAPLHRAFGIERLFVATMQAISGAGYPGVPSLDIVGNVIPFIGGEEEKIEVETRKILGGLHDGTVAPAAMNVSAHTNRVPTVEGHLEVVSVGFKDRVGPEEAATVLAEFRGTAAVAALPSSPERPIEVDARFDRPQPRLDIERGGGMAVTVGRIRACSLLDLRMVVLGHNTIRGAAGAAIQNAELLVAEGYIPR